MVVQAGLFSAVLVFFIIDKVHDLQVDPSQQMVYYQQQNVALLAQISKQVSSIAPQVSIPSSPPQPYPDFTPNPSDVRVHEHRDCARKRRERFSLMEGFYTSFHPSSNS